MITQEEAKALFDYDPDTGVLTWKVSRSNHVKIGDEAGSMHSMGYRQVNINYKPTTVHRIIWLWYHGELPPHHIDHINRDKLDNRISNLRLATAQENTRNSKLSKNNKSGVNGVFWSERTGKWIAKIKVDRENIWLGYHKTLLDAAAARLSADIEHGFHPQHGRAVA